VLQILEHDATFGDISAGEFQAFIIENLRVEKDLIEV
jgi:hypothetical protein